jgi:NodT family efflux transporter outer membrane factor (OMF) lipoprotein
VGFVPDVFGANRRQVESLAAQTDAQRFALEATYITLASNVVAAAIQEASVRAQIEATRQIIAADEKSLQILRDQFRLGFAMRIDVAAQETALAQARATLPPLAEAVRADARSDSRLGRQLPNQEVAETFELDALQLPPELPLSLPAKIIEQRPDVRAAEAQLHAANAQVGVAVAAMLPQFSITGAYGGNADQFAWMFRRGGPFWNLVGNVTQPIFEGGTLLHRKRAADDALKQAAAQYQSSVITAYQNVADTLHAVLVRCRCAGRQRPGGECGKGDLRSHAAANGVGYVNYLTSAQRRDGLSAGPDPAVQAQAARYGDTVACFRRSAAAGGIGPAAARSAVSSLRTRRL